MPEVDEGKGRERERIQLLLLIKVLCEKMSLQTSFEGRERRARMERERERIPGLYSRETEGPATILLSFEVGDAKSSIFGRRTQRPRRDIDLDKVSQVMRGSASDNQIAETGCLVFDFMFYGEPVQLLQKKCSMFCSRRLKGELVSRVLYLLEWFNGFL